MVEVNEKGELRNFTLMLNKLHLNLNVEMYYNSFIIRVRPRPQKSYISVFKKWICILIAH